MTQAQTGKRHRLVQAAVNVVHEQGFHRTTLADIAQEADVPLGNVYYYFRTKDDLGRALIAERAVEQAGLRQVWEASGDARAQLDAFVAMTLDNRTALARSGCPIGTLCDELGKQAGPLAEAAGGIFADLLVWLAERFESLGKDGREAQGLAVHLLSALQGATLLTHTFADERYLEGETERLRRWLAEL